MSRLTVRSLLYETIRTKENIKIMERAKLLLDQGDLEESFKLITNFIDTSTQSKLNHCVDTNLELPDESLADAFNTRGHIRYLWVDFDEAVTDYTDAIKRNPNLAVAYYNRGQVHYRLGNPGFSRMKYLAFNIYFL